MFCAGTCINVWWPADNSWYAGYADRYDINRGLLVKYIDGDRRYHDLTLTTYHVLTEAADCARVVRKRKFTETEVDTVRSLVECSICYEVYRDPHSLPCTHTFCKECIQHSFKHCRACPMCKHDFVLREARYNPTMKTLCDIFTPPPPLQVTTSRFMTLSSDPLRALAQITGAGTYKCNTCGGRKTARSHKCARPCPQYV